jgi:hypothetical protein
MDLHNTLSSFSSSTRRQLSHRRQYATGAKGWYTLLIKTACITMWSVHTGTTVIDITFKIIARWQAIHVESNFTVISPSNTYRLLLWRGVVCSGLLNHSMNHLVCNTLQYIVIVLLKSNEMLSFTNCRICSTQQSFHSLMFSQTNN